MDKINVMIVDDDPIWVKALCSCLVKEEDILVKGTAGTKEEAVSMAANTEVDIILMDINLSENKRDGIIAALEILEFSKARIIMVSCLADGDIIKDSFAAGAVDYISKEDFRDISGIIRKVYRNRTPVQAILEDYARLKKEELLKDLTSAEREIFDLMEQGYTQPRIMQMLLKTENTLRTQVKKILKKLGASSSKEAVKKVRTKGMLNKYLPK